MMDRVSIVIPVHNASRFLEKTVGTLEKQSYKNLEIILIENGSSDNSYEICQELSKKHENIFVYKNEIPGTSLARKRGVEEATGKYILFSDQDDMYRNKSSVADMVNAIKEDQAQICQFGHIRSYGCGIRRTVERTRTNVVFTREELYKEQVGGIIGGATCFDTTVWSKIYDANLLKEAVKNIKHALFYGEDAYLNIFAFFNKNLERVSVRTGKGYYIWNVGVGTSAQSKSGVKLFDEYEVIKGAAIRLAEKYQVSEQVLKNCHLETLYFYKLLISNKILMKEDQKEIEKCILRYESFLFVQEAKKFFKDMDSSQIWDELKFMSSKYTPKEYYFWCKRNLHVLSMREKIWKQVKILLNKLSN